MNTEKLNYKSDFKIFESCDAGYATPFRFSYYTDSPSNSYEVTYDGNTYENCKLMDDGRLCVAFDDHGMGLGVLKVERRYYLTDTDYATGICDEVITAAAVECVADDGTSYTITLALKGDKTITATSQVPAYYQKGGKGDPGLTDAEHNALIEATDAANTAAVTATTAATSANDAATAATTATEQIALKLKDCDEKLVEVETATSEAENVNAELDTDNKIITITNRNGVSKSVTIPEGGGGEGGKYLIVNLTDLTDESATTDKTSAEVISAMKEGTDVIYIGKAGDADFLCKATGIQGVYVVCSLYMGYTGYNIIHYGSNLSITPTSCATVEDLNLKVDKIDGKQLSTNDYTDADKAEVAKVASKADKTEITADYSATSTYAVGEYCRYNGTLYKCKVEIATGEDWNADHWETFSDVLGETFAFSRNCTTCQTNIGTMTDLHTTANTDLVSAINEVADKLDEIYEDYESANTLIG